MTLVKWTPITTKPMVNVFNSMDRIFDEFFRNNNVRENNSNNWLPAFDVHETDKEYLIKADLPGVGKKDVNISLKEQVLTVSGKRKNQFDDESQNRIYREANYGQFNRSFRLTEDVNPDDIKAKFKNGVLTLSIPRVELIEPEVKQIPVK